MVNATSREAQVLHAADIPLQRSIHLDETQEIIDALSPPRRDHLLPPLVERISALRNTAFSQQRADLQKHLNLALEKLKELLAKIKLPLADQLSIRMKIVNFLYDAQDSIIKECNLSERLGENSLESLGVKFFGKNIKELEEISKETGIPLQYIRYKVDMAIGCRMGYSHDLFHTLELNHFGHAAQCGEVKTIKLLIQRKCNVNFARKYDLPPLFEAVTKYGDYSHRPISIVKLLIENKADVTARAPDFSLRMSRLLDVESDVLEVLMENVPEISQLTDPELGETLFARNQNFHPGLLKVFIFHGLKPVLQTAYTAVTKAMAIYEKITASEGDHRHIKQWVNHSNPAASPIAIHLPFMPISLVAIIQGFADEPEREFRKRIYALCVAEYNKESPIATSRRLTDDATSFQDLQAGLRTFNITVHGP